MSTKEKLRTVGSASDKTKKRRKAQAAAADVVYTQPESFNRNRFLIRLATIVAVVLALILGLSIFFKVDENKIYVSGAEKYTAWEIREASGIMDGENLLTLSEARIAGKIRTQLPYVYSVRVGIKLPDTVNIEIVELDVVYSIAASDDTWWLMDVDGRVIEQTNASSAIDYTQIKGVVLDSPTPGQPAVAFQPEQETSEIDGMPLPVTVTAAQRLNTVIEILHALENNGVIGQMSSVDVTNYSRMEMWYADRYQVYLGDNTQLDYKINSMKGAIDQEKAYQRGILDVSFTTWPNDVGYTPFS